MKIGIDISQIVYKGTGVGRFTKNLVESILTYDKENQYIFFFSGLRQKLDEDLERKILDKKHQLIKWKLPPTLLSFLWNDLHQFVKCFMFHASCFHDLDWFITSDWTEPPLSCKKVTIVHDLVYKRFPETLDKRIFLTQKKRMKWVKKESQVIFADSLATKDDLIKYLNIEEEKIVVNYPGVEVIVPTQKQIQQTLSKYKLDKPFILTVGKLEPRKNLERLITAFQKLNDKTIDLVIVGPKGWGTTEQYSNIAIKQSNIKFLGFIPDIDLYSLYSSCLFFIYPSIWEGFGYPIIEAMKLGAPVACSDTSSMKEIADDAALLFDPFNTEKMLQCIDTLKKDEKLRKELITKGKKQAEMFSWERYYRIFIKALNSKHQIPNKS